MRGVAEWLNLLRGNGRIGWMVLYAVWYAPGHSNATAFPEVLMAVLQEKRTYSTEFGSMYVALI